MRKEAAVAGRPPYQANAAVAGRPPYRTNEKLKGDET